MSTNLHWDFVSRTQEALSKDLKQKTLKKFRKGELENE